MIINRNVVRTTTSSKTVFIFSITLAKTNDVMHETTKKNEKKWQKGIFYKTNLMYLFSSLILRKNGLNYINRMNYWCFTINDAKKMKCMWKIVVRLINCVFIFGCKNVRKMKNKLMSRTNWKLLNYLENLRCSTNYFNCLAWHT
jgi:hypothetical protein